MSILGKLVLFRVCMVLSVNYWTPVWTVICSNPYCKNPCIKGLALFGNLHIGFSAKRSDDEPAFIVASPPEKHNEPCIRNPKTLSPH